LTTLFPISLHLPADAFDVNIPADWQPGGDVIISPAGSCGVAKDRMEGKEEMFC